MESLNPDDKKRQETVNNGWRTEIARQEGIDLENEDRCAPKGAKIILFLFLVGYFFYRTMV